MRISTHIIVLFVLVVFSAVLVTGAAGSVPAHKKCTTCHNPRKGLEQIRETVNSLCIRCHETNTKDHKLDVVSAITPTGLPLSKENKITCITCHEPHGKNTFSKSLRMEPEKLCLTCHPA